MLFLVFLLDLRFGCSVHLSIVLEMHEIMSFRDSACGLHGKWRWLRKDYVRISGTLGYFPDPESAFRWFLFCILSSLGLPFVKPKGINLIVFGYKYAQGEWNVGNWWKNEYWSLSIAWPFGVEQSYEYLNRQFIRKYVSIKFSVLLVLTAIQRRIWFWVSTNTASTLISASDYLNRWDWWVLNLNL